MITVNKLTIHQLIAAALFVVFFLLLNSTKPFLIPRSSLRWYHMLSLAVLIFTFYNRSFNWKYLGKYKKLYSLILIVFVTNVIFYSQNYNDYIGLIISFATFLIIVPFLSNPKCRKVVYYTLIYIALMKIILVQNFSLDEIEYRELSGRGKDKNYVGMIFSMVLVMLISRIIIVVNVKKQSLRSIENLINTGIIFLILYSLIISGSRSALISLGLSVIFLIYVITLNFGINKIFFKITAAALLLLILILISYPILADKYFFIGDNLGRLIEYATGERTDINNRIEMLQNGLYFIKQKPIIGHGIGAESHIYKTNFHNTFVTFWINMGIFGVIFLVLLMKYFWDELRFQIIELKQGKADTHDLSLLIGLFPFAIMFVFIGLTTIVYFVGALLTSFTYERMLRYRHTHHQK